MKHYLLYLCAASLFFSCSKSDQPLPDDADGKMHFAANIPAKEDDWSRATRGPIIDNTTIADFGAFCFHTERSKWEEISTHATPNKMSNVKVTRTGAGSSDWTYTPPVAWDGGDMAYFTFFGYAPYATPGNGITAPASAAVEGTPLLGFVVGDEVTTQVDLLFAKLYNTAPVAKVKMQFAHALSCIGFKAFSQVSDVKVSKIQITGVKYKGDLTLDGSWSSKTETRDFTITYNPAVEVTATDSKDAVDLSPGPKGFFLLPQNLKSNTTAKIIFTFTILDGADITKEYVIKEAWEKSKRITYTVDLTTNLEEPLDVTDVSITDWSMGVNEPGMGDGVAKKVDLTFNDGGTLTPGGQGMQNAEFLISMRPTNPIETWNTKPDGSGKYYGEGDMIIMKTNTTLYNVDNTVTIGGMRWLRGNLSGTAGSDAGYYAESSPARGGMFFQGGDSWIYARESNTTDGLMQDWGLAFGPSTTYAQGYEYVGLSGGRSAGDPCLKLGAGFMTPTVAQFETLNSLGSMKGSYRGVDGMFFGPNAAACTSESIAAECVFMPLAGSRDWRTGETTSVGQLGNYWTSTAGYNMLLWKGAARPDYTYQTWALSVRCVSTDVTVKNVIWTNTNLTGPAEQYRNHRMAAYPQDFGNVFKWGDMWVYLRESSTTDNLVTPDNDNIVYNWRAATSPAVPTGTDGYDYGNKLSGGPAPGDPCKTLGPNYRTPTGADYKQLEYANNNYGYYKGVYGVFLGEKAAECTKDKIAPDCMFLPFGGGRDVMNGNIDRASVEGFYWLSSVSNSQSQTSAKIMRIFSGKVLIGALRYRGDGLSVRCVRDATIK